jgi:hypothetical protein
LPVIGPVDALNEAVGAFGIEQAQYGIELLFLAVDDRPAGADDLWTRSAVSSLLGISPSLQRSSGVAG